MKRALFVLVRIRLAEITRRPSGAFWFFALPLILLGLVAGLFYNGHPFERRHVALVGDSAGVTTALDPHVRAEGIALSPVVDEMRARARLDTRAFSAAVVTEGGTSRVLVGDRDVIFGQGLVAILGETARLETVKLAPNGYVRFLVPGMMAQSVVIAGLFGMGSTMVRYRQSRFLRKLATTPLSRAEFVLSQLVARLVLVTLQLSLMLVVTNALFDLRLTPASMGWVLLMGAGGLVTFMGVGFLVSCLVKTEEMAVDIINALAAPIALLSEIFFSTEDLPRALAWTSSALPSTAMVRSMRAVLLHGDDAKTSVLPALGILGAWAVVTYVAAVRAFKWR